MYMSILLDIGRFVTYVKFARQKNLICTHKMINIRMQEWCFLGTEVFELDFYYNKNKA